MTQLQTIIVSTSFARKIYGKRKNQQDEPHYPLKYCEKARSIKFNLKIKMS